MFNISKQETTGSEMNEIVKKAVENNQIKNSIFKLQVKNFFCMSSLIASAPFIISSPILGIVAATKTSELFQSFSANPNTVNLASDIAFAATSLGVIAGGIMLFRKMNKQIDNNNEKIESLGDNLKKEDTTQSISHNISNLRDKFYSEPKNKVALK